MTFPEGLTIAEMAKIFESHGLRAGGGVRRGGEGSRAVRDLDPAANDLEGYLFPETYALPRRTDAASSCG